MKSQIKTESQNFAARHGLSGSVAFLALFRLALLIGPETFVVKTLSHSPVLCVLAVVAVLGTWLSIDVWPFRAELPVMAKAPAVKRVAPVLTGSMTKMQRVNYLFCQLVVLLVLLQSKLTV